MKPLATFKHISSKNANYGDAEKYLTFAHDEFTMKPTLDAEGRLAERGGRVVQIDELFHQYISNRKQPL